MLRLVSATAGDNTINIDDHLGTPNLIGPGSSIELESPEPDKCTDIC